MNFDPENLMPGAEEMQERRKVEDRLRNYALSALNRFISGKKDGKDAPPPPHDQRRLLGRPRPSQRNRHDA